MRAHALFYNKLGSKNIRFFLISLFCMALVAANILASQNYNSHMFGFMDGKKADELTYLKRVWGTPYYDYEIQNLEMQRKTDVLDEWEKIQAQNGKRITQMENALKAYPYSPELYYNLYLLNVENGNHFKAEEYLKKAHDIDPSIQ